MQSISPHFIKFSICIALFLGQIDSGICQTVWDGTVDAITYDSKRDVYYVFKGDEYIKHDWNKLPMDGYPRKTKDHWAGWPTDPSWADGKVDAVVYDSKRDVYYLFKGTQYVKHKWNEAPPAAPRSIAKYWKGWPKAWGSGYLTGATYDSKRDVYYLFKDNSYSKHKWNEPSQNPYPRYISNYWAGANNNKLYEIDAVTYDNKRDIYYIFNKQFYGKHKWNEGLQIGYPSPIKTYWKGYLSENQLGNRLYSMIVASDPQYPFIWKESKEKHPEFSSKERIETTIYEMYQDVKAYDVQGVIVNGDITKRGKQDQLTYVQSQFDRLKRPIYPGLGNHDLPLTQKETKDPSPVNATRMFNWLTTEVANRGISNIDVTPASYGYTGSLSYSWDNGPIRFVQLQVPVQENWTTGDTNYNLTYPFHWLRQNLRTTNKKVIINQHIPGNFDAKTDDPKQNESDRALYQGDNVVAVFTGHTVFFGLYSYNSLRITTPVFGSNAIFDGTYFLLHVHEKGILVQKKYSMPYDQSKTETKWIITY